MPKLLPESHVNQVLCKYSGRPNAADPGSRQGTRRGLEEGQTAQQPRWPLASAEGTKDCPAVSLQRRLWYEEGMQSAQWRRGEASGYSHQRAEGGLSQVVLLPGGHLPQRQHPRGAEALQGRQVRARQRVIWKRGQCCSGRSPSAHGGSEVPRPREARDAPT